MSDQRIQLVLRGRRSTWLGRAGMKFREGLRKIAKLGISVGLGGKNLAKLSSMKVHGIAGKEFSEAIKNFNEAEQTYLSTQFEKRVLEAKIRQVEAESRLAEVNTLKAEVELVEKLRNLRVELTVDEEGTLTVLPMRSGFTRRGLNEKYLKALAKPVSKKL